MGVAGGQEPESPRPPGADCLDYGYVRRLETLGPLGHFELNSRTFIERTVTVRLDGGKMNEDVFACFALNESEALGRVKPLHSTFVSHAKKPLTKNQS